MAKDKTIELVEDSTIVPEDVIEQAEAPEETTLEDIVADPVYERIMAAQRAITGL